MTKSECIINGQEVSEVVKIEKEHFWSLIEKQTNISYCGSEEIRQFTYDNINNNILMFFVSVAFIGPWRSLIFYEKLFK